MVEKTTKNKVVQLWSNNYEKDGIIIHRRKIKNNKKDIE